MYQPGASLITLDSHISIPDEVLFREVGGEAVILQQETGKYYGLDEVGTRMWSLLTEHGNVHAAYEALLDEYDVAPERLEQDLLAFIEDLASHDLLQIRTDPS